MSVPTRGLSDMLDALTGGNQDDENKSKIHVTDEVQMHRPCSILCRIFFIIIVSAGFAKCECGYELCSGPTEHLEDARGHAAANDLFPDGAHACAGDCNGCGNSSQGCRRTQLKDLEDRQDRQDRLNLHRCQTSDLAKSTNRIHPIKELHDEALKYFEKQALLHERNVLKLVRTQKEIDRLMSVISAMEQSKYNELKFIYPPGTSPFKAPSDVAEMNEALQESLENDYVLSFTIPKGTSRRNAMNISHHASNTFIRKVTLQAQNAHLASVKTLSSKQVFLASCANLKFKQQEWPDLGLEDVERQGVDPKAAEYHALEIYRKMIDKVRQKAAVEEKKKDDDLKKKEEGVQKNSRMKSLEIFWSLW